MSAMDKARHKVEETVGKAKEKLGSATGDRRTQAEGKTEQTKGSLKQAGENAKDAIRPNE